MTGIVGLTAVSGCLSERFRLDACSETTLQLDVASTSHVSNEFSTPLDGVTYAGRAAVEAAIEGGEATARGYYTPSLPTAYVVTTAPEYHRIETETIDSVTVPGVTYSVSVETHESGSDADTGVAFADLPEHDKDAIRGALGNTSLIHAPHYPPFEVTFAYDSSDRRRRSRFIPEVDERYVEWDGELLRFDFEAERSVELTTTTLRSTHVASSPTAFRQHVGNERGESIEDPSEKQRAILEEAIEEEYGECRPHSDAFADLLATLSAGDRTIVPLVRYDGAWFFTHLARPN
ncbi:hypothetical protein [Halopenitus persicus]|uniref:hypothetical protein n=1 Tax=Halopenitus persicus TaxID=1048396 RepID=UPI001E53865C|nr:hypothetical protein [Halopenitus persicus]